MKLTPSLYALLLTLLVSACGQLPPEVANQYDRDRRDEEARLAEDQARPLQVTQFTFSSRGEFDLDYVATFNRDSQVISILIRRSKGVLLSRIVYLISSDDPVLFTVLRDIFNGVLQPKASSVCLRNCSSTVAIRLDRANGSSSNFPYPTISPSARPDDLNLVDDLNGFILNRL